MIRTRFPGETYASMREHFVATAHKLEALTDAITSNTRACVSATQAFDNFLMIETRRIVTSQRRRRHK
jgi:hypothetical protein